MCGPLAEVLWQLEEKCGGGDIEPCMGSRVHLWKVFEICVWSGCNQRSWKEHIKANIAFEIWELLITFGIWTRDPVPAVCTRIYPVQRPVCGIAQLHNEDIRNRILNDKKTHKIYKFASSRLSQWLRCNYNKTVHEISNITQTTSS